MLLLMNLHDDSSAGRSVEIETNFFTVMAIASKIGIEIFDAAPLPHFAYSYNTGMARLYIFTRQELSSSEGKISRQKFRGNFRSCLSG